MFRARMTEHEVCKPVIKDDGLGFEYTEYKEPEKVLMYITKPTQSTLNQNEFLLPKHDCTAFTFEEVEERSLIDGMYEVVSVEEIKGSEYVLGLVGFGDGEDVP